MIYPGSEEALPYGQAPEQGAQNERQRYNSRPERFYLRGYNIFNLPPVRQCGRNVVCKCDNHTCYHNRLTTQGDSARPASSTGWSARGDAPSKKTPVSKVVTPLQGYVSSVPFTRGDAPGYRIMHLRCAGPEHIPDYNSIYSLALLI